MPVPSYLATDDPLDLPAALAANPTFGVPAPSAPAPAPTPTPDKPPEVPPPGRADTSRSKDLYTSEMASIKSRQARLDKSEEGRSEREIAELRRKGEETDDAEDKLLADFAAGRQAYHQEVNKLPDWKPKPVVNAEEYQNFSMMLLGLAAIMGTAFKGGWLEASGMMNGAMQGYLDGELEKAQKNWDDFQRQYSIQMDKVKAAQKDMEDVLYADNISLAQKNRQMALLASIHGREDMRAAAEQKSIDHMYQYANSSANAIQSADTRYETLKANFNVGMAKLKAAHGGAELLTENARKAMQELGRITGGKNDMYKSLVSRWMGDKAAPEFNEMVEGILQKNPGMTPADVGKELATNAIKYQAEMAAYRQTLQRSAGVARLTLAVQKLELNVIDAAKRYGLYDDRWMNMPMNALADKLGSADYTRFHNLVVAVARQYIEAITMPGSNAQLHASSQAVADQMIRDDMTLNQLQGAFEAFNQEIGATGAALDTTATALLDNIGARNAKSFITFKAPMFSGPMTEQEMESKWNGDPTSKLLLGQ